MVLSGDLQRVLPREDAIPHHVDEAFALLRRTVEELTGELGGDPPLSELEDQVRKRQEGSSEKGFGDSGLLPFSRAAVDPRRAERPPCR